MLLKPQYILNCIKSRGFTNYPARPGNGPLRKDAPMGGCMAQFQALPWPGQYHRVLPDHIASPKRMHSDLPALPRACTPMGQGPLRIQGLSQPQGSTGRGIFLMAMMHLGDLCIKLREQAGCFMDQTRQNSHAQRKIRCV